MLVQWTSKHFHISKNIFGDRYTLSHMNMIFSSSSVGTFGGLAPPPPPYQKDGYATAGGESS